MAMIHGQGISEFLAWFVIALAVLAAPAPAPAVTLAAGRLDHSAQNIQQCHGDDA
jgi:hypothetical protein